jgi:6-phosphofructokinase 2
MQIPIAEWTREDLYVMDDSTNQQYRFIMPGAEVSQTEWQKCLDAIKHLPEKPEYLVASGSLPPPAFRKISLPGLLDSPIKWEVSS